MVQIEVPSQTGNPAAAPEEDGANFEGGDVTGDAVMGDALADSLEAGGDCTLSVSIPTRPFQPEPVLNQQLGVVVQEQGPASADIPQSFLQGHPDLQAMLQPAMGQVSFLNDHYQFDESHG